MTAAEAVPAPEALGETANERLKRTFSSWFWGSMIVATVAHFSVFAFWPELTMAHFSYTSEELETIVWLPPEIEIPPPPLQIARPATPVRVTADIDNIICFWYDNTAPGCPDRRYRPQTIPDVAAAPTFTPFTVAPSVLNVEEVQRAMVQAYPPQLRDAGIGGTARVYFFIDEEGIVQDYRVDQSSGHKALDDAALAVADVFRFSAAMNRDRPVPVWVSFPITFQVR